MSQFVCLESRKSIGSSLAEGKLPAACVLETAAPLDIKLNPGDFSKDKIVKTITRIQNALPRYLRYPDMVNQFSTEAARFSDAMSRKELIDALDQLIKVETRFTAKKESTCLNYMKALSQQPKTVWHTLATQSEVMEDKWVYVKKDGAGNETKWKVTLNNSHYGPPEFVSRIDLLNKLTDVLKKQSTRSIENRLVDNPNIEINGIRSKIKDLDRLRGYRFVTFRREDDPETMITISEKRLGMLLKCFSANSETESQRGCKSVDKMLDRAEIIRICEESSQRQELLDSFDLPVTGNTLHLQVFPSSMGRAIAANTASAILMRKALRERYGSAITSPRMQFVKNVSDCVNEHVGNMKVSGKTPDVVLVELYNHGRKTGLRFQSPLNAQTLVDIKQALPAKTKLFVRTMACHGGGLRPGLHDIRNNNAEQTQGIALATQVSSNQINGSPFIDDNPKSLAIGPTMQDLFFMEALVKGNTTYGEALRVSENRGKALSLYDPEYIVDEDHTGCYQLDDAIEGL